MGGVSADEALISLLDPGPG